jgi:hypothetical protein
MTPRFVATAAVALALAATILAAPADAAARQPIQVGSLTLAPCDTSTLAAHRNDRRQGAGGHRAHTLRA